MKTILSVLLLCLCIPAISQTRLNGYAAYVFDDQIDSYYDNSNYYDGKIKGGLQWGIGLEYMAKPAYGVELSYLNQSTTAPTTYVQPGSAQVKFTEFDMNLSWIMLGGTRYMRQPGSKVEGFGGFQLGAVILNVKNPSENNKETSATKFAWGIRGGANIWASEKMAIKLKVQLMSAVQAVGGGLYFGTGGAGAGVSSYSSMLQFGLGGGLCFALGGDSKKAN